MKATSRESNFIRHWVKVRLQGFKPERIMTQAIERGAALREIRYKDETEVFFCVAAEDLSLLKKLAGSRYKLTVLREGGLRPSAKKLLSRKLAALGLALFLMAAGVQSLFVREINVVGCKTITESEIRACLAEEGLYEGALKRFDCDAIERKLFSQFDNVVWARVAYEGNYVQVEISESEQVPASDTSREKPCSIVADQECYIETVYTYKGRAEVQEGDFVRKGQVLISGRVPIEHPTYPLEEGEEPEHYVHAEGKVVARVPYYFSFYMERASKGTSGSTSKDGAGGTSKSASDGASKDGAGGAAAAAAKGDSSGGQLDAEEEKQAQALLRQWIKENVPENAQILNKDFHFAVKENIIRVYGTIETRQKVGIEKEIAIDKSESKSKSESESGAEENTD